MKIETEIREDHQAKLAVEVDPEPLEEAKQRAARKLSRQSKIPGFRPGKAPYAVVVRQFGEGAILEEAMDILVSDIYPKVIEESGIEPYGPGSLENITSMDPPRLEFLVPLKAKVELGDYRSVRFEYDLEPVTDEEVEATIQDMRDRQAVQEPVERPVQEGDMAYVRLSGERTETPEGEDPTLIRERSLPAVIEADGADTRNEWPFPGFSRQLIGLSVGDEKTMTHTFSEESQFESLRGVTAEFHVKVEEVKSRQLPELTDEFAQSVGEFTDLEDLRKRVRQDLEQHRRQEYNEDYDKKVMDEIVNISSIKYPPQMLEREIDNVIDQLKNRLAQQNQDIDLYLKTRQIDMDALREEARPVAETRLKSTLVLLEISDTEKISVDPQELEAETARTVDVMQRVLSKEDARRMSNRDAISNLVGNIMMDMLTNRTVERIRDIARGFEPQPEAPSEEAPSEEAPSEEAPSEQVAEAQPTEEEAQVDAPPAAEEIAGPEDADETAAASRTSTEPPAEDAASADSE